MDKDRTNHKLLQQVEELRRQIAKLSESENRHRKEKRLRSRQIDDICHDIRNCLTVIIEGPRQILDGLHGEITKNQRELLSMVLLDADKLAGLVISLQDTFIKEKRQPKS